MMAKKYTIAALVLILALVLTNPREGDYLARIAEDYGMAHAGAHISEIDLLQMGEGVSIDYMIFSRYQYSLGNMSVNYFGIFNTIYYTGSGRKIKKYRESLALMANQ